MSAKAKSYTRSTDGQEMIEVAPFEYVARDYLAKFGVARASREVKP